MRILMTGASGLVGRAARETWEARGDEVWRLVRRNARAGDREAAWPAPAPPADPERLEGFDAVVHLAGAGIADAPWTKRRRSVLRESRVATTAALCGTLASLRARPRVLVCASAIGAYGDAGDSEVDEDSPRGTGFLAELVRDWEESARAAREVGIRVVHARFGIVLGRGGALARMLPAFRLGLGARLGDGRQWMSWVTLNDVVRALTFAMEDDSVSGPVNVVAGRATNAEFTRALARALRRPAPFVAPAALLRCLAGDLAREALLAGQRVTARRLPTAGFTFADRELVTALERIVKPPRNRSRGAA